MSTACTPNRDPEIERIGVGSALFLTRRCFDSSHCDRLGRAWKAFYLPMQKRHFCHMSLIFKPIMAVPQRSWTQVPSVSLGSGGWPILDAPCTLVAGAARQQAV